MMAVQSDKNGGRQQFTTAPAGALIHLRVESHKMGLVDVCFNGRLVTMFFRTFKSEAKDYLSSPFGKAVTSPLSLTPTRYFVSVYRDSARDTIYRGIATASTAENLGIRSRVRYGPSRASIKSTQSMGETQRQEHDDSR
jgi:hypothetical protein